MGTDVVYRELVFEYDVFVLVSNADIQHVVRISRQHIGLEPDGITNEVGVFVQMNIQAQIGFFFLVGVETVLKCVGIDNSGYAVYLGECQQAPE